MTRATCPICGGSIPETPIKILYERGVVVAAGKIATLTGKEMHVLDALASSFPKVCSKERLMDAVYSLSPDEEPEMKIIDVFICKVRKKIKPLGIEIETHWGNGYSLSVSGDIQRIAETA